MMQRRLVRCVQVLAFVFLSLQCCFVYGGQSESVPPGTQLPQFPFPAPDSPQAQAYLGLKAMQPFSLSDIGAKLVIVEFVSAMCPHCHENAPTMNKLYKLIQDDKALSKDIKMLGVAIGNNKTQADAFVKSFKVSFPIFPDEQMAIAGAVEVAETPTTLLVTKGGKVLTTRGGVIKDFDDFLKELRDFQKKQ